MENEQYQSEQEKEDYEYGYNYQLYLTYTALLKQYRNDYELVTRMFLPAIKRKNEVKNNVEEDAIIQCFVFFSNKVEEIEELIKFFAEFEDYEICAELKELIDFLCKTRTDITSDLIEEENDSKNN